MLETYCITGWPEYCWEVDQDLVETKPTASNAELAATIKRLEGSEWTFAKTMPLIPHEYVVRDKVGWGPGRFTRTVEVIREVGVMERWGSYNHPYLYANGFKYWTMGAPPKETTIINRARDYRQYDRVADRYDEVFSDAQSQAENHEIKAMLATRLRPGTMLDIGCGTGLTVELTGIPPAGYLGVDPSRGMLEHMRRRFPQHKTLQKAFEELPPGRVYDNVICLFGGLNYVLPYRLNALANMVSPGGLLFLMFFAPSYEPVTIAKTGTKLHHFKTRPNAMATLLRVLPTEWRNYLIFSNR